MNDLLDYKLTQHVINRTYAVQAEIKITMQLSFHLEVIVHVSFNHTARVAPAIIITETTGLLPAVFSSLLLSLSRT